MSHCAGQRYQPPARTYYVNATGGGANSGNSEHAALQTIAQANALVLKPGDRVLWKRGETFAGNDPVIVPGSGSSLRPLYFGAYGSAAAKPIIKPAAGAYCWRNLGDTVNGQYITVEGLEFDGSDARTQGVNVGNVHHFQLLNCDVHDVTEYGVLDAAAGTVAYNNIYDGGNWHHNGQQGFYAGLSTGGSSYGLMRNAELNNNGAAGANGYHGAYLGHVEGWRIEKCLMHDNSGSGLKFNNCRICTVDRIYSYKNGFYGLYFGDLGSWANGCTDNVVKNCLIADNQHGIYFGVGEMAAAFSGNLIYNNTVIKSHYYALRFADYAETTGNVFRNNIFNQIGSRPPQSLLYTDAVEGITAQTWDNNLWYAPAAAQLFYYGSFRTWAQWQALGGSPDAHGVNADPLMVDVANIYTTVDADSAAGQKVLNVTATTGFTAGMRIVIAPMSARYEVAVIDSVQDGVSLTTVSNLAQTHTGAGADSVSSLAYSDLHLGAGSPAIGAGDATLGVLQDYDGVVRGVAVDIGAFEYV